MFSESKVEYMIKSLRMYVCNIGVFFGGIRVYTVYGQQCSGVTWFHCNEQSLLKYGTLYVKIRNYKSEDFF